jgi:3-hydroxyisobutyrate dehydrogenase
MPTSATQLPAATPGPTDDRSAGSRPDVLDEPVAVCGLGGMGLGIALRLAGLGLDVTVYNRTASRAQPAIEAGASVGPTPGQAASGARFVVLSLSDEHAVTAVLEGPDGVLAHATAGTTLIDLSTTSAAFARRTAAVAAQVGVDVLDGCAIGNPFHARSGEIRVVIGGDDAVVEAARPLLECIAKDVTPVGPNGLASSMKLALNLLMGAQVASLAEAVTLASRAGIPPAVSLRLIASSGYASPMMAFRCALAEKRAFDPPAFRLELLAKDLDLAVAEAAITDAPVPVTAAAAAVHRRGVEAGLGSLDAVALLLLDELGAGEVAAR